jgi:hypothetical protein
MKIYLENWKNNFLYEREFITYSSFSEGYTIQVDAMEENNIVASASGFSISDRNEAIFDAYQLLYFSLSHAKLKCIY